MQLTEKEYDYYHGLVFNSLYPGYNPNVVESPNGNSQWDNKKKYAHIALKYLENCTYYSIGELSSLYYLLLEGLLSAIEVCKELDIQSKFYPSLEDSTIRVIEYPAEAVTNPHCDFDLFTIMIYRNYPENFKYLNEPPENRIQQISKQIHYGELLELINPKYKATYHEVVADKTGRTQKSTVFFAMPKLSTILPNGLSVKEWLKERKDRSRKKV